MAALVAAEGCFVKTNDSALAVQQVGEGPTVLFIHGLGGTHAVWEREVGRLARDHTVLTVDLPGHGASATPPRIDLEALGRQIGEALRARKCAPAVVVGHSMGAIVACWVAIARPPVVRKLVLVDSGLTPYFPAPERAEFRAALVRDPGPVLQGFFRRISFDVAQGDRLAASALAVSPSTFMDFLDFANEHPVSDRSSEIGVPVHLMASPLLLGEPPDEQRALAEAGFSSLKGFTVTWFRESMHWLFLDAPAAFDADLDAAISR